MLETVLSEDKKVLFFNNSIPEKSGISTIHFGNCDWGNSDSHTTESVDRRIEKFKEQEKIKLSIKIIPQKKGLIAFVDSGNKESSKVKCDSIIYDTSRLKKGEKIMLASPTNKCPIIIISEISCIALIYGSRRNIQLKVLQKTLKLIEKKWNFRENIHRSRVLIWPGLCTELRKINPQFKRILPKYMDGNQLNLIHMIIDGLLSSHVSKGHINIVQNCPCHGEYDNQKLFYSEQRGEKEKNMIFITT
jgi:hypothetical protein